MNDTLQWAQTGVMTVLAGYTIWSLKRMVKQNDEMKHDIKTLTHSDSELSKTDAAQGLQIANNTQRLNETREELREKFGELNQKIEAVRNRQDHLAEYWQKKHEKDDRNA